MSGVEVFVELYLHIRDCTVLRKDAVVTNRPVQTGSDQNSLTLEHRYSNRFCLVCAIQDSIRTGEVSGFDKDLVLDKSYLCNIYLHSMAAATVVYEDVIPDFTKRTPEESKLECECCIKLKLELK
jgi:hypothetical protein